MKKLGKRRNEKTEKKVTSPYVSGESMVENSQAGFFCQKFSGLQNTLPDHNMAVSEAGPA